MRSAPASPADLEAALAATTGWSQPSRFADTGAHHGYRQVTLVANGAAYAAASPWQWLLDGLSPVWSAWLSWIDPGGFIVEHIDAGPYRERWQIPITAAGRFDDRPQPVGVPFRVHQFEWHAVANPDPVPRVVLVADRDVLLDVPHGPFLVR